MRIAYFIASLKKEDGVCTVLLNLVRESLKQGIECVIVTGYVEDVSLSPVPVIRVPSVPIPLYKEYKILMPGMWRFEKQLSEFRPDVLHLHSPESILSAVKYGKKYNSKVVVTHHTNFAKYLTYYHLSFFEPLVWFILKYLYKKVNILTTPSPVTTRDLANEGIDVHKTIPWAVNSDMFNPKFHSNEWRKKILGVQDKKIILSACRLTWEKDLKTFVDVALRIKETRNDFQIVMAGDGPVRKELQALLPDAIFLGHIDKSVLSTAYASSDILFFPSSTEVYSNSILEAMASGLPLLVADAGGAKIIVKNGENGLMGKPLDTDDFCNKLNLLLDDDRLRERLQKANLEFVHNFSWGDVFNRFLKLYDTKDTIEPLGHFGTISSLSKG